MRISGVSATAVAGLFLVAACGSAAEAPQTGAPDANASAPPVATPVATQPPAESAATSPAGSATEITVESIDSAFDVKTIEAPANSTFKVTFHNAGEIPHDLAFYDKEGGAPLAETSVTPILQGGETATITFTTPGPGTYFFVCLVHPQEMTGSFIVN